MRSKFIHFILGISLFLLINCKILGEFGILCPIDEFAISMFDETHHAFSEACENEHKEDIDCFCEYDFSEPDSFKFIKSSILSTSLYLLRTIEHKTFSINSFLNKKSSSIPNISVVLLTSIHLLI